MQQEQQKHFPLGDIVYMDQTNIIVFHKTSFQKGLLVIM